MFKFKYFVVVILLVVSCSEKEDSFFKLNQLEANLKKQTSISISNYKLVIGKKKEIYDTIVKNHLIENNDAYLLKKFGLIKDNEGKYLNQKLASKYLSILINEINHSVNIDLCNKYKNDTICEAKKYFKKWILNQEFSVYGFNETIEKLYRNSYFTEEEYHTMIICGFILNSLKSLEESTVTPMGNAPNGAFENICM